MSYVVLDTDVASLSFRGRVPSVLLARLAGTPTCITFVTLAEMTQWAVQRQWGPANRERLTRWLSGVVVLPGSEAATCLVHELPLATLNVKDFSDFAEHEGLTIITD